MVLPPLSVSDEAPAAVGAGARAIQGWAHPQVGATGIRALVRAGQPAEVLAGRLCEPAVRAAPEGVVAALLVPEPTAGQVLGGAASDRELPGAAAAGVDLLAGVLGARQDREDGGEGKHGGQGHPRCVPHARPSGRIGAQAKSLLPQHLLDRRPVQGEVRC